METVEASGKSIEDAILQALAKLGRNRDEVEIAILQEPSRGTRGMGAREARVRVRVKPTHLGPASAVGPRVGGTFLGDEELDDNAYYAEDQEYADAAAAAYADPAQVGSPSMAGLAPQATVAALKDLLSEDASIEEFATLALQTILDHMGVRADVVTEDTPEDQPLKLNIVPAADYVLGTLIGRRGETLAALQLLVNLVTYKQTGEHERVIVDVEGYRDRREENLRSMAERIAQQVRDSGRPVMLEAMPPNERRIVHMSLAEYDDISTESSGEGDQRRVVVSLKHSVRR